MRSTTDNKARVHAAVQAYFDVVSSRDGAMRLVFETDTRATPEIAEIVGIAVLAIAGILAAGVSSLGEFQSQIEAGTMRLLAVSAPERIEGVDAPTLKEAGLDVELQNWRMVAAAPGITAEQKAAITTDIEKMAKSAGWQEQLAAKGWSDTWMAGADFDAQLAKDTAATEQVLKSIGLVK